jgi:hypothetical protein
MSDLTALDWARITDLAARAGLSPDELSPATTEVLASCEETCLKFNTPTPVHYLRLRTASLELELFHWRAEDEWELVHASSLA